MNAVSSNGTKWIGYETDFECADERRLKCPSFNLNVQCMKQ